MHVPGGVEDAQDGARELLHQRGVAPARLRFPLQIDELPRARIYLGDSAIVFELYQRSPETIIPFLFF